MGRGRGAWQRSKREARKRRGHRWFREGHFEQEGKIYGSNTLLRELAGWGPKNIGCSCKQAIDDLSVKHPQRHDGCRSQPAWVREQIGAGEVGLLRIKNVRQFDNEEMARNKASVRTGHFFQERFFTSSPFLIWKRYNQ